MVQSACAYGGVLITSLVTLHGRHLWCAGDAPQLPSASDFRVDSSGPWAPYVCLHGKLLWDVSDSFSMD